MNMKCSCFTHLDNGVLTLFISSKKFFENGFTVMQQESDIQTEVLVEF